MEALGYSMTATVIDAADCGVPQNRLRVFIVGSFDGPIHLEQPGRPHVAARTFIDWDATNWSPVDKPGRAARTLERIANGRRVFGDEPFLAPYYGSGSGLTGRSLDRPIGTVRTRDAWSLVHGDRMRMLTLAEYIAAQGFREDYVFPSSKRLAVHMIGNSVPPPMAAEVVGQVKAALGE